MEFQRGDAVSIIIRTLNEEKYLAELLQSIFQQKGVREPEVIIVDSGSTDRTLEIANDWGCIIANIDKAQFSFGRSLNTGCDIATGEILVFISGHCVPISNTWLENLCRPLIDLCAGYSYGRQTGRDSTKYSEQQHFQKYFSATSTVSPDNVFCNNANSAITRHLWAENKFDEYLPGLEDMELAKRLIHQGSKIAYVAEAAVYHIHDESWSKSYNRYKREAIALQWISSGVNFSAIDALGSFLSLVLSDVVSSIKDREVLGVVWQIFSFRSAQCCGTFAGSKKLKSSAKSSSGNSIQKVQI